LLNLTRLLYDVRSPGDPLRYDIGARRSVTGAAHGKGPVVAWNVTSKCNLACPHCYYDAGDSRGDLSTEACRDVVDQLVRFRVPVILFSGGEPTTRPDLLSLVEHASGAGCRTALSSNGTTLDRSTAGAFRRAGLSYVGISFDGVGEVHDRFRCSDGSFALALRGLRACREAGLRVGIRFTITRRNASEIPAIFDLARQERVDRLCFYHLVLAGRGRSMSTDLLAPEETRQVVDRIVSLSAELRETGARTEVLTVNNHADGVYLYLLMRKTRPQRAVEILENLKANGGNRSGIAIAAIDHRGNVHPDQFTMGVDLGNVTEQPFEDIWGGGHELLEALRNRRRHLKGRCSRCAWLDVCGGNLRARAQAQMGDFWAEDPGCYLTDREIHDDMRRGVSRHCL